MPPSRQPLKYKKTMTPRYAPVEETLIGKPLRRHSHRNKNQPKPQYAPSVIHLDISSDDNDEDDDDIDDNENNNNNNNINNNNNNNNNNNINNNNEESINDDATAGDELIDDDAPTLEPSLTTGGIRTSTRIQANKMDIVNKSSNSVNAVRIAIGAKVISACCILEFQPEGDVQCLLLTYKINRDDGTKHHSADNNKRGCNEIQLDHNTAITEIKYFIAGNDEEEKGRGNGQSQLHCVEGFTEREQWSHLF